MNRPSTFTFVLAMGVGLSAVFGAPAFAEPPDATRATYLREVHQANERLAAGEVSDAETLLRNALTRLPDAPEAHCTQGSMQLLQQQAEQALETFATCRRLAQQASNAWFIARALQGRMMAYLALPDHIDDARAAAMELLNFAQGNTAIIDPAVPRARVQSIDLIVERDAAAADVRARREARERENAAAE